ncbi:ATP-dependent DNA ligase [Steroidobacter sp. S1-65]|uniref:DNA ligase (ATP) n=1 Tax=Steroidobacter gossypii TaxID=2805490 RepID=A0ABS1X4J2_9GAMM|nr:ATP-dependent DNA ligase [Steroidobacter gossypii]MBM0108117.1 ATP-dependent DNA ligase [Steroidobacter gossypii]
MRAFAALYEELDTTQSTNLKVAAMSRYFRAAPPADAAWATYILSGRRLKRFIGPALLKRWLIEEAALPEWLIDESYSSVGDLAETIALLTAGTAHGDSSSDDTALADWLEERLLPLRDASDDVRRQTITGWWRELPYRQCFLLNKLLTGELRVGVSQLLVTRALADVTGIERTELAGRLMGEWQPGALFWQTLHAAESPRSDPAVPYPFFLASPLEGDPVQLGERADWQAEWKWDGIRGQLIRRAGECHLWSRGEERITERFPEIVDAAGSLPDGVVLDGEVVAWKDGRVQPFALLQQRIGRKKLTAAILSTVPVRFLAYDLLELDGQDYRSTPLRERREQLEKLLQQASPLMEVSPLVAAPTWEALAAERAESRKRNVEGLMLKALDSSYGTGRQRGAWWKWKIDPHSFDAVMIYAQPGQGRRSNLYTDYTFGVWRDGELVPVAKAYSGLSNSEISQLDRWIRAHTVEKFGPVRSVEPTQVFELAYEGIAASGRHKSGIALRFPRIVRWRTDKPASEADTLADLQAMLTTTSGDAPDAAPGSS